MITELLGSIVAISQRIYVQVKLVKANQAQCQLLKERVDIVVKAVQGLDKIKDADHYRPGLLAMEKCLNEALVFIQAFAQKSNFFDRFIKGGDSEAEFKKLNEQLQKVTEQLNLGLVAQQVFNREQDLKAQQEDIQFIKKELGSIVKLHQEQHNALQKLQIGQVEQTDIILKQMNSYQEHLMEVLRERFPADLERKQAIEESLRVPFYELLVDGQIGQGAFGKVYAGRWCKQTVAIKMIEGNLSAVEQDQFVREVQIMSRLRSPHIVQLYGACVESGRSCLVMEYMEKGSLYEMLAKGPLSPEQQKKYAISIAKGLLYLHARGTIHRDIKSANILIDANNEVKLTDFGLSSMSTRSIKGIAEKSQAIEWQAPECLQANAQFSPASDTYAFGMVLWELVTGKRPFAQIQNNRDKVIVEMILSGKRESFSEEMPAFYQKLILACWDKNPKKRPALEDILIQLEAYKPVASPSAEICFQQGVKCEESKDFSEAFKLYQKAAQGGHIKAHTNLGYCYLQGQGVKQDLEQALHYFNKGAEQGHARAMNNLAAMYNYGKGTARDPKRALDWYMKAAALGDERAKQESIKLRDNLDSLNPPPAAAIVPMQQMQQQQQPPYKAAPEAAAHAVDLQLEKTKPRNMALVMPK